MKTITLIATILLSAIAFAGKPNHDNWNALLKKHVNSSGKVNYANFKKDMTLLDAYITDLKTNTVASDWSANEKKAYWINVYNAHTIKLVLTKYPIKSINDLKFDGKSAFDYKWIEIGGAKLSLNDLESTKLRTPFKDPRIHFAINCASGSCPILLNKAFTADNVEASLTDLTKKFLADKTRNKISKDKLEVSKIFEWYKDDFTGVTTFISKYSGVTVSSKATITYLEYDWSLNKQ